MSVREVSRRRWVVGIVAAAIVGCAGPDATPPHQPQAQPLSDRTAVITPAELHRRNPLDWVGVNHNKFLELFRKELVAHGPPPGGICDIAVKVILAHPELLGPGGKALTSQAGISGRIREACLGAPAVEKSSGLMRTAALPLQSSGPSPAATDLTNQVHTLGYQYTDPTSFSTALSPILNEAATLPDSMDVQYVDGDVSTAQSSWDYWMNPTDEANEQASFDANYDSCIKENQNADYESICLGMTQAPPARFRRTSPGAPHWSYAAYSAPQPCAGMNWYQVGGADVVGFTTGVESSWLLGPQAALAAGATRAAAASAGMAWWQFAYYRWCYYQLGGT